MEVKGKPLVVVAYITRTKTLDSIYLLMVKDVSILFNLELNLDSKVDSI